MRDGFPDRPGSPSHTLRLRVRSVLTDRWMGIEDIQKTVKERWLDDDSPTKGEIGRALKGVDSEFAVAKPAEQPAPQQS